MDLKRLSSTAFAASLVGGLAGAADLNVPSPQFPTIQDALDAAVNGDRVLLAAGTFTGARNRDLDPLGKEVQIVGAGAGATVIDVQGGVGNEHRGFWIEAGGAALQIRALAIRNGYRDAGAALYVAGDAAPSVVDCEFSAGSAFDWGGAVYVTGSAAPLFEGCTFDSNGSLNGGAVAIDSASNPVFSNCTFTSNASGDRGGAVFVDSAGATFVGCTFAGNTAATGGAAALYSGTYTVVSNSTFDQNSAAGSGGALFASYPDTRPTLANCSFTDNAAQRGGAIALDSLAELEANTCTFERNQAQASGGALEVGSGASALLLATDVRDNGAATHGGGVFAFDQASLSVNGGTFANNGAAGGGAVHLASAASAYVVGTTFDHNHALAEGGAVRVDGASPAATSAQLFNCSFTVNDAARGGGLYANDGAGLALSECTLDSNTATVDGGAICCVGALLSVSGGTLTSNVAALDGGGAALASGADADFDHVSFSTNAAGADGGALHLQSPASHASLTSCDMTDNEAAQRGGGIAISDAQGIWFFQCNAFENRAAEGGGLALTDGANVTLSYSTLANNHALQRGGGGAVDSNAFLTAEHCVLIGNESQQDAGGLDFDSGDGALRWCLVQDNTAAAEGGGLRAGGDAFVRVHGGQLSGNHAVQGAGMLADDTARLVLGCSTVIDNQAALAGGGVEYRTPNLVLANTIVWGNSPDGLHDGGGSAIVNYCDVQGGAAGAGNIAGDPRLVLLFGTYWAPDVGSPCIDAGDNARVPPLVTVDLLDRPRWIDDPWTADTGAGVAPVVDIGAVEFRHEPVSYCQGRVNSQGCEPVIAYSGVASGWPNACAGGSFWIYGLNVINNTDGILFFGLSGRVASPWLGGTLCVRQPIRRTPLVNSFGNPPPDDCSGGFAFEFSAWVCNDPTLVPGTLIDAQWWGRDFNHSGPFKAQLSNALEFVLN